MSGSHQPTNHTAEFYCESARTHSSNGGSQQAGPFRFSPIFLTGIIGGKSSALHPVLPGAVRSGNRMREPISRKGTREATRSRRFLYLSGCSSTAITPLRPHRPQHLSRPADNPLPSLLEVRTKFERRRSAARDLALSIPPDFIASPLHCVVLRPVFAWVFRTHGQDIQCA